MTAERQLETILDGLKPLDAEKALDGDLSERFSAVVGQTFLIDVILVDTEHYPDVSVVLDIYRREGTHNIHDDFRGLSDHVGLYAVRSLHDAVMRIASAVVVHEDTVI
jgi:hypothetical protein